MHSPVLLLLISVSWMILDQACPWPVPPNKQDLPDFIDVLICAKTESSSERVCNTIKVRSKVFLPKFRLSGSETRARRQVPKDDLLEEDEGTPRSSRCGS
ncbi:hypothetical protein KR032_009218 [Drosophila birchii]|nr:hypothetical protein KR032_009218 [Drosophila birchii]